MLPKNIQEELNKQAQESVDEYLKLMGIPNGTKKVSATCSLAGLIRVLATVKIMLPQGLTEGQLYELSSMLYEDVDGEFFTEEDDTFWSEGTHAIDYDE